MSKANKFDESSDHQLGNFIRTFTDTLKKARLNAKLTQEELAVRAGVDRTHISDIERGINVPSLVVLYKLARGLELSPYELLCAPSKESAAVAASPSNNGGDHLG
jgi:transcriptional regulator with XRE-family HTH domain